MGLAVGGARVAELELAGKIEKSLLVVLILSFGATVVIFDI
jgi:hypothetical protein